VEVSSPNREYVLPFKSEILLETIIENVPAKFKNVNKKAFELGLKSIKK